MPIRLVKDGLVFHAILAGCLLLPCGNVTAQAQGGGLTGYLSRQDDGEGTEQQRNFLPDQGLSAYRLDREELEELSKGEHAARTGVFSEAVARFRPLAKKGYPVAQYYLGRLYANGFGVERDSLIAASWYEKAALQGFPPAQFSLAEGYREGRGVRRNPERALELLQAAARQGHADAMHHLCVMLGTGDGVAEDVEQAYFWCLAAAMIGHPAAAEAVSSFDALIPRERRHILQAEVERKLSAMMAPPAR